MPPKSPIITIHAVRRYAERVLEVKGLDAEDPIALGELRAVHGVDTVEIERHLLSVVRRGVAAGAMAVRFRGARFMLTEEVLTTILTKPKKRRRPRVDHDRD